MVSPLYVEEAKRSSRSPEALAEAVDRLRGAPRHTIFQPDEQRYIRTCRDFTVAARMDHINALWTVCCESNSTGWSSGTQRCPASMLPEQALDWGEQLWHARLGQPMLHPRADAAPAQ
jgi:hypothetical protein